MEADDLIVDRPLVATVLVALIATVAWVAIQLVLGNSVEVGQLVVFVVVFTIVYVVGNWYLRRDAE